MASSDMQTPISTCLSACQLVTIASCINKHYAVDSARPTISISSSIPHQPPLTTIIPCTIPLPHHPSDVGGLVQDMGPTAHLFGNSLVVPNLQPAFHDPASNAMAVNLIQQSMARQTGGAAAGLAMPVGGMPSFLELPIPGVGGGRNAAAGLAEMFTADPSMLMRLMGGQMGGDQMQRFAAGAGGHMRLPYAMGGPAMGGPGGARADEVITLDPRE